eukprot:Hpha_TRINITY_DN16296_c2_g1::TRINITY_DN16296_c2_g1_i1::g.11342::m.11342/K10395/KIF4_21_27; kinesin family member 4/21/27
MPHSPRLQRHSAPPAPPGPMRRASSSATGQQQIEPPAPTSPPPSQATPVSPRVLPQRPAPAPPPPSDVVQVHTPPPTPHEADGCQVRVAVRLRPLLPKEVQDDARVCVRALDQSQVVVGKDRAFTFDHLFGPDSNQAGVYEVCVKPLMAQFLKGYNCTIFAYGQTGTGKTFTMGTGDNSCVGVEEQGIVPRVVTYVFATLARKRKEAEARGMRARYCAKVSYIEIYNETLRDLLHTGGGTPKLQIREDSSGAIVVAGVQEKEVRSYEEMLALLDAGTEARATGATMMNEQSSRSHAILTVTVEQTVNDPNDPVAPEDYLASKLHLVDLAGSERNKKTQATGTRFKESVSINCGLLALGNVISVLADEAKGGRGGQRPHVPYRESKLTRLLQDSLGGNARTLMIACVSPADSSIEESLNTLKYANRAKNICNKPVVNRDPHAALVAQLRSELVACRGLLESHGIGYDTTASILPPTATPSEPPPESLASVQREKEALEEEVMRLRVSRVGKVDEAAHAQLLELIGQVPDANLRAALGAAAAAVVAPGAKSAADTRKRNATPQAAQAPQQQGYKTARLRATSANVPTRGDRKTVQPQRPGGRTASKSAAAPPRSPPPQLQELPSSMLLAGQIPTASIAPPDPNAPSHVLSQHAEQVISENQKLLRNLKQLEDDLFKSEFQAMQENAERKQLQSALSEAEEKNVALQHRVKQLEGTMPVPLPTVEAEGKLMVLQSEVHRLEADREQLWQAKLRTESEKEVLEKNALSAQRAFQQEFEAMQQKLTALAGEIQQKQTVIAELVERDRRAAGVQQQHEQTINDMEQERERLRQELQAAMRRVEGQHNVAEHKRDKQRADLRKHYEQKLREQDQSLQELRKKQREASQLIRKHGTDEKRICKLQGEVQGLQQQQEELRNVIKNKSDSQTTEREQRQRQLGQLQRQIRLLETENTKYSQTLKGREESIVRLQQQLNLEKSRTRHLTEREAEIRREVNQKQTWLDREIEIQKRKKDAQDRLQRELRRRSRILREREENMTQREAMQRSKETQQDESRLSRALAGWGSQIQTIEQKLRSAKTEVERTPPQERHGDNAAYTAASEAVERLEGELQSAKGKYSEISNAQVEAADLDNQLRQLDDRIDVLQAALDYGEDIIVQTEREIETLTKEGEHMRNSAAPPSPEPPQTTQQPQGEDETLKKAFEDRDKENEELKLKLKEQTATIEKYKNALKLADMGFNRRLLKVQMEQHKLLGELANRDA